MLLGLTAGLLAFGVGSAASSPPASTGIPVDRQDYVVDAATDPYASDDTALHVGTTAGDDYARSFVHLALDYLPDKALVGGATLRLQIVQSGDASTNGVYQTYNVNHTSSDVVIQACALTKPMPVQIDAEHPEPAHDCAKGASIGVPEKDADGALVAYTFDLKNLVKAWSTLGNTGAAIVPLSNGPTSNWTIAFSKGYSTSRVTYRLSPAPPPGGGTNKPAEPPYYRIPVPAAPPAPAPVVSNAPAPQPQPTVFAAPPITVRGQRSTAWMWVLPVCLAMAALLTARPALTTAGVSLRTRIFTDWRLHPRSYAIASILVVWALLFTSYSVTIAPPTFTASSPVAEQGGTGSSPDVAAPGASVAPNATTGTRGPSYTTVRGRAPAIRPGSEFEGPGTYRIIGNTRVFFPADGRPPAAQLYTGQDDIAGINFDTKTITLCGHAALTFGPAFNIGAEDLNVFWQYLNAHGGIGGWKFDVTYNDDGYDPGKAVAAAQRCEDAGTFMTLGGIGFDQIPAVRSWAESHKELYLHHMVTTAGSDGLRYSFTGLPSEEQMGTWAGQYAVKHFRGKRVGIVWRESPNWQSGRDLFKKVVKACGCIEIVGDYPVQKNQGSYTTELTTLKNTDRADVIFAWENALATAEMIEQAQDQEFHPDWIVFPFNLELWSLDVPQGSFADGEKLHGIAAWDAYVPGYKSGGFAPYGNLIDQFEAQYAWARNPGPQNPQGNDLLFLAWQSYYGMADLFRMCLPECTRNRMAGILLTYHKQVPGLCDADYTRLDGHHGGWLGNVFETFRAPDGRLAWRPSERCVEAV